MADVRPPPKEWLEFGDFVLKLAVAVIGGIWAVALLRVLRKREIADAELRRTDAAWRKDQLDFQAAEAAFHHAQVERQARERSGLTLEMQAEAPPSPIADGHVVMVGITLRNTTHDTMRLDWDETPEPVHIYAVRFDERGAPVFTPLIGLRVSMARDPNARPLSLLIRPGNTEELVLAARVPTSGLYLVTFRANVGENDVLVAKEAGVTYATTWSRSRYVIVPPPAAS